MGDETTGEVPTAIAGRDLLAATGLSLCVVAVIAAGIYWTGPGPDGTTEAALFGLLSGFAAYAGVFAAIWITTGRRYGFAGIGLRRCDPRLLNTGVFAALLWVGVTAVLYSLTGQWEQSLAGGRGMIEPFLGETWLVVLLFVLAGPVAGFVEEIAFRGLLYGWLRGRMGTAPAALISAVLFTAVHFHVYVAGFAFVVEMLALSVLLALLFELSRSLWPGIVCHALNNLSVLALYVFKG